jgi:hypothetical protein
MCCIAEAGAQSNSLAGTWNIYRVDLRQTVDNRLTQKTFTAADLQNTPERRPDKVSFTDGRITEFSIVNRPGKILFTAGAITLEYAGGQETGDYRIEGNRIRASFPTHPSEYTFELTAAGELRLSCVADYVINDGTIHPAKDECMFYGRKQ